MFDRLDDTIVAISSPAGVSPRGILRLSGPEALALAATVFEPADGSSLTTAQGHRRVAGRVRVGTAGTLIGEAYTFRAPASYTRQDVAELHTIGSPPVLAMLLDALIAAGARLAEPGEFTARAFMAGAMDLTRAEGVAAIINARTDAQLRASEALLHGELSKRTLALREELADLLALIEAEIDFVEEAIDFVTPAQVAATIGRVGDELESLLTHSSSAERLELLPQVVLVGRANAGKSTLFNRLSGMDRAITSATSGTTRDVLSAPVAVPGGEVMLLDCAGLTASAERDPSSPTGPIETSAEAAARRAIQSADLILIVLDGADRPADAHAAVRSTLADRPCCTVLNKVDRVPQELLPACLAELGTADVVPASATVGTGFDELRRMIGHLLFARATAHGTDVLALSHRQRAALRDALAAATRVRQLADETGDLSACAELVALEVREAMNALSTLTGELTTEDLLGRVFSRFCVGK